MSTNNFQVDFDCEDRDVEWNVWFTFWESGRSWLLERGYTLYEYGHHWDNKDAEEITSCSPKIPTSDKVDYPFSFFGGDVLNRYVPPLSASPIQRIAYAQDSLGRHYALKLVKENSEEYKIVRHIFQEQGHTALNKFEGILPIINCMDLGNHRIIVMPRWGDVVCRPYFSTCREILDFIRSLLKGLRFLHKHHIVHRVVQDITLGNVVVNHFDSFPDIHNNILRKNLRRDGHLVYGIIDFGISIMLSPATTFEGRRLPSNFSYAGGYSQPNDTTQGELDYDPYAFDVGCLGVLLCEQFQHVTPSMPMLAPLLDRMTTRDIEHRFTANEALEFLEDFTSKLTPEELQVPVPPRNVDGFYDRFDKWSCLPEKIQRDWAHFREPKLPYRIILMRQICTFDYGLTLVQWFRRTAWFGWNFLRALGVRNDDQRPMR